uniref:uncharacterized protein At3g27210-like n=1 Tax=Erigeron canadensis TaxID=72917 RepID=UPI001CB9CA2F|nr:uncharacterized protein At3g27210-like [Erigeron canadensis]
MGSCVSSHKKRMKNNSGSKSDIVSIKNNNHDDDDDNNVMMMIPPSPIKEKVDQVKPQWVPPLHSSAHSRDFGSKEMFFDSQAWLDSDCESDFMSVNGEFTPSRGNTPVHHNFSTGTPIIKGGAPTVDDHKPSMTTPSDPSPTLIKKKKRLSDLFSESIRENHYNDDDDDENEEPAKDNEVAKRPEAAAVHGGGLKQKRERWAEIVHVNGCLPRALSSCRPVNTQHMEARKNKPDPKP